MRQLVYLSIRARVRLSYPGDFLIGAVSDLLTSAVGLLIVVAIFTLVPTVVGWTAGEVLLCWGFAHAAVGLNRVVFGGITNFNRDYVLGAKLDRVLLRPLDPYFQVLADGVSLQHLPTAITGLVVLAIGAQSVGTAWTAVQIALLPLFVIGGAAIIGALLTASSALGLWRHHQGSATGLASHLTAYGSYPIDFLPRPVGLALVTIVPLSWVGFVPATLYMDRAGWAVWAPLQPLIAGGVLAAAIAFWRFSLRRYASTGH